MSIYLRLFDSETAYTQDRNTNYFEPWVSYTEENREVNYNKSEEEKKRDRLLGTPLTFNITGDGVIRWLARSSGYTRAVEYKKNDGEWTTLTSNTGASAPSINVVSGDTVQFRGNNSTYASGYNVYNQFSGTTCSFSLEGNIMSLVDSENFVTAVTLDTTKTYTFAALFQKCTGLTDASKLMLPATTLANSCYYNMFQGCSSLMATPELPATTLADSCYSSMFDNCISLTTPPELPATTLAQSCYSRMFQYCSALTSTPELPSESVPTSGYVGMFASCTSLTTAPELPATQLANGCYYDMFYECTNLVNVQDIFPATTLALNCYSRMFYGCTSLTTAPVLPATTLANSCYSSMFYRCQNLTYVKAMFLSVGSSSNITSWLTGVSTTGTFVKNANATWADAGIPEGWTIETASE